VLVAGVWVVRSGDDEPSPDDLSDPMETLDRFLDAQRAGDCAGLRAVVSEDSWSLHGGRTAGEFDRLCEDALEGHTVPAPAARNLFSIGSFGVEAPEPGTRVEVTSGSTPEGAPEGAVLWDGERWLVELDPHVLSLGRSPRETVERYVAAYGEGDCDTMFDHLGPDLDTPDARDACERWAALRADSEEPPVVAGFLYPTTTGGAETAQVEVDFDRRLHPTAPGDTAHLVVDGLEWVIESTTTGAAAPDPTAPPFVELRYHDLAAALLDQAPSPGGSCRGPTSTRWRPGPWPCPASTRAARCGCDCTTSATPTGPGRRPRSSATSAPARSPCSPRAHRTGGPTCPGTRTPTASWSTAAPRPSSSRRGTAT